MVPTIKVEETSEDNVGTLDCYKKDKTKILATSPISPNPSKTLRRKLVVIGDGACGKTSLLLAYKDKTFNADYVPTVFETSITSVPVEDRLVELALWDTAGQEDYDRLRPLSYPDTDVLLLCFAIDKPDSKDNISKKWIHELKQYAPMVPIILVGCKADLRHDASVKRSLTSIEDGVNLAENIGAVSYIECSALTRYNVDDVFAQAARVSLTCRDRRRKNSSRSSITNSNLKSGKKNRCSCM